MCVCDQTTFLYIDMAQFQLTVQLMGISVVSSVFVIVTMLPWLSMYEFFCGYFFSSLEPKTESGIDVLQHILTCNIWRFQFFHLLARAH